MIFKTALFTKNILFFAFLLLPLLIFGQKHFEQGFVVLKNNDTLYGLIKDRKPHPFSALYKKIRFKGEEGKFRFGPDRLLSYKKGANLFETLWVEDTGKFFDQNFASHKGSGKPVFLKVVEKGFLTYYHWEHEDPDSGYIDFIGYFKKENDPSLIRATQGIFGLRRKHLINYVSDCPPLVQKLADKEIDSAIEVTRFYNEWKNAQ